MTGGGLAWGFPVGGECSGTGVARWRLETTAGHITTLAGVKSTGVGGRRGEPIGDSLGELMKGLALSAGMAADLAVVEDQ